jgi:hypothetical protein
MTVSREQLVEMLRARGDQDLADRAQRELPPTVDPAKLPPWTDGLDLPLDAGDADRHGSAGRSEDMTGLPERD